MHQEANGTQEALGATLRQFGATSVKGAGQTALPLSYELREARIDALAVARIKYHEAEMNDDMKGIAAALKEMLEVICESAQLYDIDLAAAP